MSKPHDHDDCDCNRPIEAANVLLKCKTECNITVPVPVPVPTLVDVDLKDAVNDVVNGNGTTLVSLTINTKKFKDPCFKFDFSANIVGASNAALSFQIYKLCKGDNRRDKFGPAWTLTHIMNNDQIISFFVCDCDNDCDKDDCCTYSVVVTATARGAVTFNNPTLSALVVEKNCHCR
jgi:hypothetical protein